MVDHTANLVPVTVTDQISNQTVLFVCTGNTCRSPMAAAIAQHACSHLIKGVSFVSAGILASAGAPITVEAGIALKEMGVSFSHASQRLTKDTLTSADFVFAMEQRHFDAVAELMGELSPVRTPKVKLMAKGRGVPDPLGQSLKIYRELADFLMESIPTRLVETGLIPRRGNSFHEPSVVQTLSLR